MLVASYREHVRCLGVNKTNIRLAPFFCQIVPAIRQIQIERRKHLCAVPFATRRTKTPVLAKTSISLGANSSLRAFSSSRRGWAAGHFENYCLTEAQLLLSLVQIVWKRYKINEKFQFGTVQWGLEFSDGISRMQRNFQAPWTTKVA